MNGYWILSNVFSSSLEIWLYEFSFLTYCYVLVCLGPIITKYHRLELINRNLFLAVLGARRLRLVPVWSGEDPPPDCRFLMYLHMAGRGKGALLCLFYKGSIPIHGTQPLWPNHLPKVPLNTNTMDIRFSTYTFWGDTNI